MGKAASDLARRAGRAVAGVVNRMGSRNRDISDEPRRDSVRVMSSWISNLTLVNDDTGDVVMALLNGRRYRVRRVGQNIYNAWANSPSKGKFWHNNIKLKYRVTRLV